MSDIVKQILLRFKGDTKPLEKDVESLKKVATSLDKTFSTGSTGKGGIVGMSKAIDTYTKTVQKFGMTLDKDMTKFGKQIQQVATRDLGVLKAKTEDLFRKSSDNLKKLGEAEKRLASSKVGGVRAAGGQYAAAAQARKAAGSSSADFAQSLNDFNEQGGELSGKNMKMIKGLAAITAIAESAAQIGGGVVNYRATEVGSSATVAQVLQQQRAAKFSGNAVNFLMEQRDKSISKARAYAEGQTGFWAGLREVGGSVGTIGGAALGGALTGGAIGTAAGAIGGPLAAITGAGGATAGAIAAGGVATISQGFKLANYFSAGARQARAASAYSEKIAEEKLANKTASQYQYQFEKAGNRYEYQRRLNMSDDSMIDMIKGAGRNMFGEDEAAGTALGFRNQFGTGAAGGMTQQAMALARQQGMGLDVAQGLVGSAGMQGRGGVSDAKKVLGDIFTTSFSKGLTDSGLIETMQKGVMSIAQQSPDQMDLQAIGARLAGMLEQGKDLGVRDVQGAMTANQRIQDMSTGGGELGILKMSKVMNATGGNVAAMRFLEGRTDQEISDLAKNNDPRLVGMLGAEGVKKLATSYSADQTLKASAKTAFGQEAMRTWKETFDKTGSVNEANKSIGGYLEGMTGGGKLSVEAATALSSQFASSMGPAALGVTQEQIDAGKKKDLVGESDTIKTLLNKKDRTKEETAQLVRMSARKQARDIEGGVFDDVDQMVSKQLPEVDKIVDAARNHRAEMAKTRAESIKSGQVAGAVDQAADANELTDEEIQKAQTGQQSTEVQLGGDIASSTQNLKRALDAFSDSVTKGQGTSATATSSGGASGQ